ncbi:MAG: prolipoprotein diacylglyceryl transferase [Oscillospiraceae bacterium]|nr:prolipoprotein diacylglyceryl transferase [Oscillospiraceae bacterium]
MNLLTATMLRSAQISFPMLGDWSIDPPYSFNLFGLEIYFYGVIIALGFILAALYCAKRAKEFGLSSDELYELVIWLIPTCIIGARLYYVLFKLDYFIANPDRIFALRDGGLAIYGGIIAGIIVGIIWCRAKRIRVFAVADLTAFGLLIGQSVGRWGNFINREAFGAQTEIFCRMGLTVPGFETLYVHPTFLYESLWNLLGLIVLHIWSKKGKRKYDGQVFWLYILWYGLGRAWIEGLRTDSLYIGSTDIRVSQLLAIVSAVVSLAILIINARKQHNPEDMFVNARKGEDNG